MTILQQILNVYFNDKHFKDVCNKNTKHNTELYFKKLLDTGNIVYLDDNKKLMAWMEVWCVNYKQLGVILSSKPFVPIRITLQNNGCVVDLIEDISNGDIAYISDLFIVKEYRYRRGIINSLRKKAVDVFGQKETVVLREHKYNKRIRIFNGGK